MDRTHTTYTYTKQLSRHTGTGWSGGGGGSSTRGRTESDGAEQRPPGRPLLRLPRARRLRSSSAVRRREAWRRAERDCRCREAAVMWRGERTTSARRTGRSSSGSRAVTESVGQRGPVRPARFVARYGLDALGTRPQNPYDGKGACGAAKFTPRGTTYVFVNVVVAPRYVARVQLGSGGL